MLQSLNLALQLYADYGIRPSDEQKALYGEMAQFLVDNQGLGGDVRVKAYKEFGSRYELPEFSSLFFTSGIEYFRKISIQNSLYPVVDVHELPTNVKMLAGESGIFTLQAGYCYISEILRQKGCTPIRYLGGGINSRRQFEKILQNGSEPVRYYADIYPHIGGDILIEGGMGVNAVATVPGLLDTCVQQGIGEDDVVVLVLENSSYIWRKSMAIADAVQKPEYASLKNVQFIFATTPFEACERERIPDSVGNLLGADYAFAGVSAFLKEIDFAGVDFLKYEEFAIFCCSMAWPDQITQMGWDIETCRLLALLSDMRLRKIEDSYSYNANFDIKWALGYFE